MENAIIRWLERKWFVIQYNWFRLLNTAYREHLEERGIDPDSFVPEIRTIRKEYREKLREKRKKEDEVIITCPQCGQEYKYESLEKVGEMSPDVRCGQCGCKYLLAVMEKMEAMLAALEQEVTRRGLRR